MPIIQSAIKRARQNPIRRKRRLPFKTYMKTMIKKLTDIAKAGKAKEAQDLLPEVYKSIDTAAKKNILHPNTASRKKSGMAKLVAGIK